ncbi:hypothetical protein SLEP1_g54589 [Rubroshorea leprosula]|uniref:PGG domain-containing protein n=1 Tax=Rubroshorea leprosula TaxID=152421 RepID=A0AAV5MD73_9ROSI|nr:hypothetical protein SLEP1_g54589 [Rubroshorea leprosula]
MRETRTPLIGSLNSNGKETRRAHKSRSWFKYFQYEEGRDSTTDARNVLLVVATLIAAVAFQSGVNPPGGVWQDDSNGHVPGRAIYASQIQAYYVFLISNTVALSASILVIISLTYRFPFQFEIMMATISMLVTYGAAIFAVTPFESIQFWYVLLAAALPFVLRGLIHGFYRFSVYIMFGNNVGGHDNDDV